MVKFSFNTIMKKTIMTLYNIHTTVDRAVVIITNFLATYDQFNHMSVPIQELYDFVYV